MSFLTLIASHELAPKAGDPSMCDRPRTFVFSHGSLKSKTGALESVHTKPENKRKSYVRRVCVHTGDQYVRGVSDGQPPGVGRFREPLSLPDHNSDTTTRRKTANCVGPSIQETL